jgi:transposase-like protein
MMNECKPSCDYSKAVVKSRATWCCAKCGRDFSMEYLFWAEAAHPEWFSNTSNILDTDKKRN